METITGQIIALTALVGAVYGLWAAIQAFFPKPPTPVPSPTPVVTPVVTPPPPPGPRPSPNFYSIGSEVAIQDFTFKIVEAKLDDHKKENPTLRFTIRITSNAPYDHPMDDRACRLVADDIPTAPIRDWNALVHAHSAVTADFIFAFPTKTKSAALQFWDRNEHEEIPLNLPSN